MDIDYKKIKNKEDLDLRKKTTKKYVRWIFLIIFLFLLLEFYIFMRLFSEIFSEIPDVNDTGMYSLEYGNWMEILKNYWWIFTIAMGFLIIIAIMIWMLMFIKKSVKGSKEYIIHKAVKLARKFKADGLKNEDIIKTFRNSGWKEREINKIIKISGINTKIKNYLVYLFL